LNAAGGPSAISSVQDYTATGTITYNWANEPVQAPATIQGMGPGNFRIDSSLPDGTRTWAMSGFSGVLIMPDGTRTRSAFYNLLTAGSLTLPIIRIDATLADSTSSISYVGLVTLDNSQQAQQIHIAQPVNLPRGISSQMNLGSFDVFVDPNSFLLIRLKETVYSNTNLLTSYQHELDFSTYRSAGNILVPFSITEKISGQQTWAIALNSIAFNSGLTDSVFNP
jgi:hypothetical protein